MQKSNYIQPFTQQLSRVQAPQTMIEPLQVATQVLDTVDLGTINVPNTPRTLSNTTSNSSTIKEQIKTAFDSVLEYLKKPMTWVILVVVGGVAYFSMSKKSFTKKKRR